jgi:holo-[acyl-carrier protein] synthase
MDILGVGTHIIETHRVRNLIQEHAEKFLEQVFTEREWSYCRDRTHSTEFYAAFWAAKEAVFRSLGIKWRRGMDWKDVEILCENAIEPRALITGAIAERMTIRGVTRVMITFSYSRLFATAHALAIRD